MFPRLTRPAIQLDRVRAEAEFRVEIIDLGIGRGKHLPLGIAEGPIQGADQDPDGGRPVRSGEGGSISGSVRCRRVDLVQACGIAQGKDTRLVLVGQQIQG